MQISRKNILWGKFENFEKKSFLGAEKMRILRKNRFLGGENASNWRNQLFEGKENFLETKNPYFRCRIENETLPLSNRISYRSTTNDEGALGAMPSIHIDSHR